MIILFCLKFAILLFLFHFPSSFHSTFKMKIVLLALILQFDSPCSNNFFCFSTKGAKPTAWQSSLPLKVSGRPIWCIFPLLGWTKWEGRLGRDRCLFHFCNCFYTVCKTNAVTNLSILFHLSCQICLSNS